MTAETELYSHIRTHLRNGRAGVAKQLATEHLAAAPDDTLHYLYGLACARLGEFHEAINAFVRAERLNPQTPAIQARKMLEEIFAFRNTDMINP